MISILVAAVALLGFVNAVPPSANCGKPSVQPNLSFMSKVVGGRESVPNSWPWQIQMRYNGGHFCGGSILSNDWMLTASHCIHGKSASSFSIRAGRHTRTGTGGNDRYEQVSSVSRLITHESYSSQNLNNDVALIRISKQFTYNAQVSAVCLTNSEPSGGTKAYVTGWGNVQGTGNDGKLKQAMLPIVARTTCSSSKYWGNKITSGMICAGHDDASHGACNGDSGGPLVIQNGGVFDQVGVVSWGSLSCTQQFKPTVFANVKHYRNWITSKVVQVEAEEELAKAKRFMPRLGAAFRAAAQALEDEDQDQDQDQVEDEDEDVGQDRN